jgi:hypothetical protein
MLPYDMLLRRKGKLGLYVNLEELSKQEAEYYDPLVKLLWKQELEQVNGQDSAVPLRKATKAYSGYNSKLNNYFKS